MTAKDTVIVYTDGSCIRNPGPGGFGVVMMYKGRRKELSGGYRRTTNNRMEILAVLEALQALTRPCTVKLHTDSQYVVNTIEKGWAKGWRKRGWVKADKQKAKNVDLWARMLDLLEKHKVKMVWVKGHAGNTENERCDELARNAATKAPTGIDEVFESGNY
ncbi:MAG: ribonuclease HI [Acidobacteriota bacterium]|nr:ribonuclease HI [Acidobacteriota bacterium]